MYNYNIAIYNYNIAIYNYNIKTLLDITHDCNYSNMMYVLNSPKL